MPSDQGTGDPSAQSWVQGGLFCRFPDSPQKLFNLGTEETGPLYLKWSWVGVGGEMLNYFRNKHQ